MELSLDQLEFNKEYIAMDRKSMMLRKVIMKEVPYVVDRFSISIPLENRKNHDYWPVEQAPFKI